MSATPAEMSPEATKRLNNIAKFWSDKLRAATTDADLARVCFDRARSAAVKAERGGGNKRAMHELAQLLAAWAEQQEQAEIVRRTRHSA
ncbi:hypothetical protein GCM10010156_48910 [Planobispora rosea]|uniref:Uncharacterized protein n=1 Tax=Planobispora rosea TaxID=35762 RepID=A0A8J3WF13_PLARO|nr:hypothetical protein [Planobispora rosea]GGS84510.1 hypothetical protein GCM10010156_48910 [Planobispora rosea]GIH86402.1 hypothetical protein Pro02_48100 [Planobispora rosea]